jgi:heme-degrading monooxygenase HmoA
VIARVAIFNSAPEVQPDDARRAETLRSLVRGQSGFKAGYHMHDPSTGRAISMTIWESEEALVAAGGAVASRPKTDRRGIEPGSVEIWEVDAEF